LDIYGNTKKDKMKNEDFHNKISRTPIEEKIRENTYDGLAMRYVDLQRRQSTSKAYEIRAS